MTEKDEKLLAEFEIRMRQLMHLCNVLKEENIRLRQDLIERNNKIEDLISEVDSLKLRYDNLKFAKSFSSENSDDVQQAKRKLSKLVQDVDKCIVLLKNN